MMAGPKMKKGWKPLERMGIYRVLPLHLLPVSLGMKILFVLFVIVVAGFFVTLRLGLGLIYDNIWRETQDKLMTDLKIARMLYDGRLKDVEAVVEFTADRFFLPESMEAGNMESLGLQIEKIRRDRDLDVFTLVDKDGKVLLRTTAPYTSGDNLINDVLVRRALAGGGAAGTVVIDRDRLAREGDDLVLRAHIVSKATQHSLPGPISVVDSGMMLMAAYPVINRKGAQLGVLYGGKLINNNGPLVDSIMERIFPEPPGSDVNNAMVSVFFWDLRVATTIEQENGSRATGSRIYQEVGEAVLNNGKQWLGTSWVVHDWYFAAYEPIRDPEGKVIGALGLGVWKAPFIALRDKFILRYVKISLSGLVVVLILGLIFSRMLTKPLRELVEASGELAQGKLEARVKIKPGRDEIRDLELAFNAMAHNLHQSMEDKDRLAGEMKDLNQRYMELLGFASHEIKQPIGVLALSISNLRKMAATIEPEKMEAILDRLDRNTAYIASMSEKYLHYSKIESGQLELSEVKCRVLADVIEPALEGEQKNIHDKKMSVEIPGRRKLEELELYIDPQMMRVVFSNLISNAVKYGYSGGYIKIGMRETEDAYVFNVKNNGEGIPGDKLGEIFEKFRRLDNVRGKQKGTGLGLFNAREMVELHGGKIWAESEPGKWADLIFQLPKQRVNPVACDQGNYMKDDAIWGY